MQPADSIQLPEGALTVGQLVIERCDGHPISPDPDMIRAARVWHTGEIAIVAAIHRRPEGEFLQLAIRGLSDRRVVLIHIVYRCFVPRDVEAYIVARETCIHVFTDGKAAADLVSHALFEKLPVND